MVNNPYQYQCSSKALIYNKSIGGKSKLSYLIIDIEPSVNPNAQSNDRSLINSDSYAPNRDTSLTGIYIGIGLVVLALICLLMIIKCIHRCYKSYQSTDDDDEEEEKKEAMRTSPLLPSSTPVNLRRKSSIRNPSAPIHRSSLDLGTQIELRQKRLSLIHHNTPPPPSRT